MRKLLLFLLPVLAWGQSATQIDWVSGIKNVPYLDLRTYNFSQSLSLPIPSGIPSSISIFCPLGVSGTDSGHYIYISDGALSETVAITGGTCRPQTFGTLTITPTNAHIGTYSINSATAGITEAINSSGGHGIMLIPPNTTWQFYASPLLPSGMQLQGAGESSVLQLGPNSWPNGLASVYGASGVAFSNFLLDMNGAAQGGPILAVNTISNATPPVVTTTLPNSYSAGVVYIQNDSVPAYNGLWSITPITSSTFSLNGGTASGSGVGGTVVKSATGTGLNLSGTTNSHIDKVKVINMGYGTETGQAIGVETNLGNGNVVSNSTVHGTGGANGTCAGGIFFQTPGTTVIHNYIDNLCDEAIIASSPWLYYISTISNTTPPVVTTVGGNTFVTGDVVTIGGNSIAAYNGSFVITGISGTQFSLNGVTAAGAGSNGAAQGYIDGTIADNEVVGNNASLANGTAAPLIVVENASHVNIVGNRIGGNSSAGIVIAPVSGYGVGQSGSVNITSNTLAMAAASQGIVCVGGAFALISGITNATPPVVTTATSHGYSTGQIVYHAGTGIASYNGMFTITVTGATTYSLNSVTASGVASAGMSSQYPVNNVNITSNIVTGGSNGIFISANCNNATARANTIVGMSTDGMILNNNTYNVAMKDNSVYGSGFANVAMANGHLISTQAQVASPNYTDDTTSGLDYGLAYSTVASSATLTLTTPITFVTGTVTVSNIVVSNTLISSGMMFRVIPQGNFSFTTGGNIVKSCTTTVNVPVTLVATATGASSALVWYASCPTQ